MTITTHTTSIKAGTPVNDVNQFAAVCTCGYSSRMTGRPDAERLQKKHDGEVARGRYTAKKAGPQVSPFSKGYQAAMADVLACLQSSADLAEQACAVAKWVADNSETQAVAEPTSEPEADKPEPTISADLANLEKQAAAETEKAKPAPRKRASRAKAPAAKAEPEAAAKPAPAPRKRASRAKKATATEGLCEWFAGCGNKATKTEAHPILGAVPICDRCADKIAALA